MAITVVEGACKSLDKAPAKASSATRLRLSSSIIEAVKNMAEKGAKIRDIKKS